MEDENAPIKTFQVRRKANENQQKEDIIYLLDNVDDVIFNKICFLCNSQTPNCSLIQARGKDEDGDKLKDLEQHNFALGMIKIDNAMKPPRITKGRSKREKQVLKPNSIHEENSLDEDDEIENNSNIQLQDEEAAEGGEEEIKQTENGKDSERRSDENKEPSVLVKSNTNVKMSLSARVRPKPNDQEPPESPLPVIKINNRDKEGVDTNTNEETPVVHDQEDIVIDEDNPDTSRQLKSKKHPKKQKKERFVNLKFRYDGFNKLRFVYSRVIPR